MIHQMLVYISQIVYDGARKSVTSPFKFDSDPERKFAISCENSPEVLQWLRPAKTNLTLHIIVVKGMNLILS